MQYSFPVVVLTAIFASSPALAQSRELTEPSQAPSAFLGVDLRGDFMNEVPECASEITLPGAPCRVATTRPGYFEVRGLPYLPISPGYKLFVTVVTGTVSQLMLTGNANNLYLVKELLIEQLGVPSDSASQWVRLNSGASYEAEAFKWNTQGVTVDFGRDPGDLGRYSVTFSTSAIGTEVAPDDVVPVAESVATPNG